MNIYTTTKNVTNVPKLIKELKELPLTGSIFNTFVSRGEDLEVNYSENLVQAQVDEIANHINTFVEVDIIQTLANSYAIEASEGFEQYRKIMADIILSGGLNASVDESIKLYVGAADKSTMVVSLMDIRCMLKDSLYQYTMRALHMFLDSGIGFSQETVDKYSAWIEPYCIASMKAQGYDDATITAAIGAFKTVPKGMM